MTTELTAAQQLEEHVRDYGVSGVGRMFQVQRNHNMWRYSNTTIRNPLAEELSALQQVHQVRTQPNIGGMINVHTIIATATDRIKRFHPRAKNTEKYTDFYRRNVLIDFEYLDKKFPIGQLTRQTVSFTSPVYANRISEVIGGVIVNSATEKTFSFGKSSETIQVLFIHKVPALILVSIMEPISKGDVRSVYLQKILPTKNQRLEKLKRLFLRHLNIECIRNGNKLKLCCGEFPANETITIFESGASPNQHFRIGSILLKGKNE
jgi:hypothetical protein